MLKTISLQNKLIKNALLSSILAGLLGWCCLIGVTIYQSMNLHDEFMQEISEFLLGDVNQVKGNQIDDLSEEFDIEYALYLNDQLLTTSQSQHYIHPQDVAKSGYSFDYDHGRIIRIYTAENEQLHVKVVQPLHVRFEEVWQSILSFSLVLLLLWLIQLVILYILVKRQLKPLRDISQAISSKSALDLTPIDHPQPPIQELQPIVDQLNLMLKRVEQSILSEQRFTADASHELRSPLSAIQLRLQLLKRKYQQNEALSSDLTVIQADVRRGTAILENLLFLARLDPTDSIQTEMLNIDDLIQKTLSPYESALLEKNIQVQLYSQHIEIQAHQDFILICLRNLLENALKYTPEDGEIRIESGFDHPHCFIQIENSGEGLPADVVARLGERFYRVLGTDTQGSGLGLSIVKKIMDLHQADLLIESSPLGGLKVRLEFKRSILK
ncbi:HAMP domain-containing protein [Acinetobacter wanghuae]|uniref:histidine kinase n=1 Tax=Acinetobacter wanghuae TaxID=2662362 RepID=A0A5Q0P6D9_9GAMM|nr:ATP-binding protein [Acinetobacter wanghuae]MQW92972.1 HAMP domain-containing protein [Acinetobacter wanghuae]QGA12314.1 HAMP domain-containing protein [Acinetobacter wanghuae]